MIMEDRIHWMPRFLTSLLVDVLLLASSDKLLGKSADIINKTKKNIQIIGIILIVCPVSH